MQIPNRKKTKIMIHCLATRRDWMKGQPNQSKFDEVVRWHVGVNGWAAVAYAEIIFFDGEWIAGRDRDSDGDTWEELGAGARGHNTECIHLALEGGHGSSANDDFYDNFTPQQNKTLRARIAAIFEVYGELEIVGHNEYANKACPGFQARAWFDREPPRGRMQSGTAQGAVVAAVGTAGTAAVDVASELQDAADAVGPLTYYAPTLQWVFVALTLAGIGYTLWRRIGRDWARGRR